MINKSVTGLYFSGTGNTEYAVKKFIAQIDPKAAVFSITDPLATTTLTVQDILPQDLIVFGYPVYFSDTPKIVKDFIVNNKTLFAGKKVFVIATMGLISGDGTGVGARAIKKFGAEIIGGLHIKMPDSIADEKAFAKQDHSAIIAKADRKIESAAEQFKNGKPTKHGLSFANRMGGLFMQRLWFGEKTKEYQSKPNINRTECIGCGVCAEQCPTNNLKIQDGKITCGKKCTLCYRCVNLCPKKALTILGKKVYKQKITK